MEWITSESHTFVIRLWLEESSWESNSPSWRGHITHYPSGNRRYVSDLDEIAAFILLFLEEMGVAGKSANRAPPAVSTPSVSEGNPFEHRIVGILDPE